MQQQLLVLKKVICRQKGSYENPELGKAHVSQDSLENLLVRRILPFSSRKPVKNLLDFAHKGPDGKPDWGNAHIPPESLLNICFGESPFLQVSLEITCWISRTRVLMRSPSNMMVIIWFFLNMGLHEKYSK